MACSGSCGRCGVWSLVVRRGVERWCLACCMAVEFVPAPGRSLRGYVSCRLRDDDRRDDREKVAGPPG